MKPVYDVNYLTASGTRVPDRELGSGKRCSHCAVKHAIANAGRNGAVGFEVVRRLDGKVMAQGRVN